MTLFLLTLLFVFVWGYLMTVAYAVHLTRRRKSIPGAKGAQMLMNVIEHSPEWGRVCPTCHRRIFRNPDTSKSLNLRLIVDDIASDIAKLVSNGRYDPVCLFLYGVFLIHSSLVRLATHFDGNMRLLRPLAGLHLAVARRVRLED